MNQKLVFCSLAFLFLAKLRFQVQAKNEFQAENDETSKIDNKNLILAYNKINFIFYCTSTEFVAETYPYRT